MEKYPANQVSDHREASVAQCGRSVGRREVDVSESVSYLRRPASFDLHPNFTSFNRAAQLAPVAESPQRRGLS